jgi:hypothetical protein
MRLEIDPPVPLLCFDEELVFVISMTDGSAPELIVEDGTPRPDRHLLLGMAQNILMALDEMDPDLVAAMNPSSVVLQHAGQTKELKPGLLIARNGSGQYGAVMVDDPALARSLARQAVRWFMGGIRLDVP